MEHVTQDTLEGLPENARETVRSALANVFGSTPHSRPVPVGGGASGALIYRCERGGRDYLLRVETRRDALRNPHQHVCMQTAAGAGIAPPLHYVDEATGIAIMDFIAARPLSEYPGGRLNLARDLGTLIARLQETPQFPELYEYPTVLARMLGYLRGSGAFAAGLLDPHLAAFERIREAYPWTLRARRSSHNDPNPNNILFDGERLWLIDWETAYRNEPMVDVAILADNFASTPDLENALLHGWSGRTPDRQIAAQLTLLRPLTRLYYAGLVFAIAVRTGAASHTDLNAPTPAEFRAAIADGRLKPGTPETMRTFAKMLLAGFLSGASGNDFEQALAIVRAG